MNEAANKKPLIWGANKSCTLHNTMKMKTNMVPEIRVACSPVPTILN